MDELNCIFSVDDSLKEEVTRATNGVDLSGAQSLREFVQQQNPAVYNAWFAQEVQMGLDSANAGKLIPNADVEARFAARRAATRSGLDARQKLAGILASK